MLKEEDFKVELEMCNSKVRWEIRKQDDEKLDEKDEDEIKLTESEKELQDEIEAESRQPYNPVENKIDLRRRRVTDLKENTRVYLPKPLPINEEAKIQIRRERLEKVYRDFVNENCTDKGEQRSNLTSAQKRGIASLKKRIKDGELIVRMTDKSGKLVLTTVKFT